MDKLSSQREGKKEIRSKRLLCEAFFELLKENPGEPISVKELCDKAGYARQTFYAHFNQIEDVPYYYFKENWLDGHIELYATLRGEKSTIHESLYILVNATFDYWTNQIATYKLLKSIEMESVLLKLFQEATQSLYEKFHPSPDSFINSISGKCIIKGHAQLSLSIYDIWAYSVKKMDPEEMTSILIKIIDGTSGLSENQGESIISRR